MGQRHGQQPPAETSSTTPSDRRASGTATLPAFADLVSSYSAAVRAGIPLDTCLADASAALLGLAAEVDACGARWPAGEVTYARHLLARCPLTGMSLFAVVWRRDQVSPVHDHGTWGVVTVVRGALDEQRWFGAADSPLVPRDPQVLTPGTAAAFTNQPEYVHRVHAATDALSLHLYGDEVASYHVYDVAAGTRTQVQAAS